MRSEFIGSILAVREVEDCIRATKKYTKGAFTKSVKHPMQGEEFPSRVLTEYYEVYPDTELSWDMSASEAWAWVWGDVPHIDVRFHYNYQQNKAMIVIYGGNGVVEELKRAIPQFGDTLVRAVENGNGKENKI